MREQIAVQLRAVEQGEMAETVRDLEAPNIAPMPAADDQRLEPIALADRVRAVVVDPARSARQCSA